MPSKLTRAQRLKKEILNHLGIVFASIFFAAGYSWFLLPYNMAPGGVGGISQILNSFFGLPNGVSMVMINIPLFIISFLFIGKSFGSKSLYGMFVSAMMTDFMSFPILHKIGIIGDLAKYTHLVNGRIIYA
ncbi:MAG TPA: YitT family protein, partial [Candidatus Cloacimonadota bacterium]|nr:YitT family protein [Candidatus Cloacimonadota bacterium]